MAHNGLLFLQNSLPSLTSRAWYSLNNETSSARESDQISLPDEDIIQPHTHDQASEFSLVEESQKISEIQEETPQLSPVVPLSSWFPFNRSSVFNTMRYCLSCGRIIQLQTRMCTGCNTQY